MELDELLDGEAPKPVEETQPPEPEAEAKGETDEPPASPEPEPAAETVDESPTVPKQALLDERRKRQELEQRLAEKAEQKPTPSVFEDEEAYNQHIQQQIDQRVNDAQLNISEMLAKRDHPDLDEKVERYKELIADNPALHTQVMATASPYHEVVAVVEKAEKLEKLQDVDKYEAQLRTELEAKIRAEYEAKAQKKDDLANSIPQSLSDLGSKGGVTGPSFSGPTPLDNILD